MSKYKINTTGITDGISNLNINIAGDNNHTSNSSIAKVGYSTKQTFIDIHVEDGQIVDTGSLSKNLNYYYLFIGDQCLIKENDNPNKIYNNIIRLPIDGNRDGIRVSTGSTTQYLFQNISFSAILVCKINRWITDSTIHYFFYINNNATKIENRSYSPHTIIGRNSKDNIKTDDLYNKLNTWVKIVITGDVANDVSKVYIDNQLCYSYSPQYSGMKNPISFIVEGAYSEVDVEYLKVISGVWTPENQIDLED